MSSKRLEKEEGAYRQYPDNFQCIWKLIEKEEEASRQYSDHFLLGIHLKVIENEEEASRQYSDHFLIGFEFKTIRKGGGSIQTVFRSLSNWDLSENE